MPKSHPNYLRPDLLNTRVFYNPDTIFVVGGRTNKKTELLSTETNHWSTKADYPYVMGENYFVIIRFYYSGTRVILAIKVPKTLKIYV